MASYLDGFENLRSDGSHYPNRNFLPGPFQEQETLGLAPLEVALNECLPHRHLVGKRGSEHTLASMQSVHWRKSTLVTISLDAICLSQQRCESSTATRS